MRRLEWAYLFAIASFFAFLYSGLLGWALLTLSFLLAYPYLRSILEERLVGLKLHEYEVGEWKLLRETRAGYEVVGILEVVTTSGTLESVDPLRYSLVAKDIVEVMGSCRPTLVIHRGGDGLHYYVKLTGEGRTLEDASEKLATSARVLRSSLSRYNLELHPRKPSALFGALGVEPFKPGRKEKLVVLGLGALTALLLYYIPLLGLFSLTLLLPLLKPLVKKEERYKARGGWYGVEKSESIRYSRTEVYHYTVRVSETMNSKASLGTSVIISVSPASLKEQAKMERKAARKYMVATLFDWLGTTMQSIREIERATSRRFGDIPESLFYAAVLTNNPVVKEDLESLGFETVKHFTPYPAVQVIFHEHKLRERQKPAILYTLDLAFFTPYIVWRFLPQEGVYLGRDERENEVYLSPRALPNFHAIYVGGSGTGKSLLARHVITELVLGLGANVCVIDPHGEYGLLIRTLGGVEIPQTRRSTSHTSLGASP